MSISKGLVAALALTTAVNIVASATTIYNARGSLAAAEASQELVLADNGASSVATPPGADGTAKSTDAELDALVGKAPAVPGIDEAAVEKAVRNVINKDPSFILDAINAHLEKKQQEEAFTADRKTVEQAALVTEQDGYPVVGNKDGKLEVFYYFDINCGYCKKIDAELREWVKANPEAKLVHREMPILTPASKVAAQVGGVLYELYPEAYPAFHDALLSNPQSSSVTDIQEALKAAAGEAKAADVAAKTFNGGSDTSKAVNLRIERTLKTSEAAGIGGTPFIYVKGLDIFVRGAAPDLIDRLNDAAKKSAQIHGG